jgi:hypothetical protein
LTALELTIDGAPWFEAKDLTASGPDDRHYVLDRDSGRIHFGDGAHGAVPAAGATFNLGLRVGSGAKRNAPSVYRLDVPQGGTVVISTHLAAQEEPGDRAKRLGCFAAIVAAVVAILARRSRN